MVQKETPNKPKPRKKPVQPEYLTDAPLPTEKDIPPEVEDFSPPPPEPILRDVAGAIISGQDEAAAPTPKNPDMPPDAVPITLYFPSMFPINGRIITIGIRMQEQKTTGGIYLVPKGITRDNIDRLRSNPNEDMMYFVVGLCPTVNRVLRDQGMLPKHPRIGKEMRLEIGDQIITSPNMEPIYHREMGPDGLKEFWIWHHMDILGIRKDPGNVKAFEENSGMIKRIR